MSQLSDLLETMSKRGESPSAELSALATSERSQEREESHDSTAFALRKMRGVRPQELPSFRAEIAKRERDKRIREIFQRLEGTLSKNSGSDFHTQLAEQPAGHVRATEQSAANLPRVNTSRPAFEPVRIQSGESVTAALTRMHDEAEERRRSEIPVGESKPWPDMAGSAIIVKGVRLPSFIVKFGSASVRCENCALDFPAKQFGPSAEQRALDHVLREHRGAASTPTVSIADTREPQPLGPRNF